jgi:hypothetical protein
MKREDQVKDVLEAGATVKVDVPVTLRAIKQRANPVRIGHELVDRVQTYLRIQLPTGHFIDCRVEGNLGESALNEALAKDPYFKPFYDAKKVDV